MANWYGTSRSNYVRAVDDDALLKACEQFGLKTSRDMVGRFAFFPDDANDGWWPSTYWTEQGEEEVQVEFDFSSDVMPLVKEGEVLVVMSSGAEKLRYVTGNATAFIRRGSEVSAVNVNLDDIYNLAHKEFALTSIINNCSY